MDGIFIVAPQKSAAAIETLLRGEYRDTRLITAFSGSQARRLLPETACDLVVISAPLSDENGVELAAETAARGDVGVVLLVKTEFAEAVSAQVEEYGVFVVEKPLHKPFFFRAIRLVIASGRRLRGLESENAKLQKKIEEVKLVDRAKLALIQYLGLTESQAHRYIEKQAMDLRQNKREVAQSILKTYEI